MRLATILLVALSLVTSALGAGILHVHAPIEHAHEDHHQGVAAHTHLRVITSDDTVRIEACDPAAHLRILSFISVEASGAVIHLAPETLHSVVVPTRCCDGVQPVKDARVHGPPLTAVGLRAPPFTPAV